MVNGIIRGTNENRGFAPLECWNTGTMEQWVLGKMGKWNIGNIPLENIVKSMHKKTNSFKDQSR